MLKYFRYKFGRGHRGSMYTSVGFLIEILCFPVLIIIADFLLCSISGQSVIPALWVSTIITSISFCHIKAFLLVIIQQSRFPSPLCIEARASLYLFMLYMFLCLWVLPVDIYQSGFEYRVFMSHYKNIFCAFYKSRQSMP